MAGRAATEAPVDAEAEAARGVPAGQVAAAVNPVSLANPANPANLADNRPGEPPNDCGTLSKRRNTARG
jgi:hypothetical protein